MSGLLDLKVGDTAVVVTSSDVFYEVVVVKITPSGIIKTEKPSGFAKCPASWRSNGREIGSKDSWSFNTLYHEDDPVVVELKTKAMKRKVSQTIKDLLDKPYGFELNTLTRVLGLLEEVK